MGVHQCLRKHFQVLRYTICLDCLMCPSVRRLARMRICSVPLRMAWRAWMDGGDFTVLTLQPMSILAQY